VGTQCLGLLPARFRNSAGRPPYLPSFPPHLTLRTVPVLRPGPAPPRPLRPPPPKLPRRERALYLGSWNVRGALASTANRIRTLEHLEVKRTSVAFISESPSPEELSSDLVTDDGVQCWQWVQTPGRTTGSRCHEGTGFLLAPRAALAWRLLRGLPAPHGRQAGLSALHRALHPLHRQHHHRDSG
jgi:hypothetical protein